MCQEQDDLNYHANDRPHDPLWVILIKDRSGVIKDLETRARIREFCYRDARPPDKKTRANK